MTAVVVSIHRHEFEGYGNNNDDLPSPVNNSDDDLPTNDSLDQDSSQPQFSLVVADINDRGNDSLEIEESDDASMKDAESTTSAPSTTTPILPAAPLPKQLGGLNNMGNTCYLNSALQMLASLDEFGERIKLPYDSKLRESLVEILERLRNGENVRPEEFKSVVDERSPLFIGYRQQDSHEFLTTLLDLLDEDYKKKDEEEKKEEEQAEQEQQDEQQPAGGTTEEAREEPVSDAEMEDVSPNLEEETEEGSYVVVEKEDLERSPIKKQKLDDGSSDEDSNAISSFIDLKFSDIESLLHGDKAESPAPTNQVKEQQGPKCKLVGGRMSTAGVQLTPLDDGSAVLEETSAPAKADADDAMSEEGAPESPVDSSFATELRVCLTCDSCKYRRSHTEKYLHLSLEIGENCSSIEDGLRKFFAPEKLEIKCEKCFCESAMQTKEITRLPRAMLFHLKRFIVKVSPDYTSISYSKDQSAVSFEECLPFGEDSLLAEYLATDVSLPEGSDSFGIRSVVNHIGSSASCGHYTADARRRYEGTGRGWTRFNDSIVSKISDREAVEDSARTAYMIMYEIGA
mmetsp:Transcript_97963/g.146942  ORF Transcript_97963/g.146942 Transcript_97963/m.146942 type:complete len:571 (-) Transcript_97963:95-1807(-)